MGNSINNRTIDENKIFNEIIEKSKVSKKSKEKLSKYKDQFNNDSLNKIDILQYIVEEYLSLKENVLSKNINANSKQIYRKRLSRLLKWIKMIFDNKLNNEEEYYNIMNEMNLNMNVEQKDKINYILFSQVNTPNKINFNKEKDKSTNEKKIMEFNHTINSSTKRKRNSYFSNIIEKDKDNPYRVTDIVNEINFNIEDNLNSYKYSYLNNTTPIKKRTLNKSPITNSIKSNFSKGIPLNKISLNLVHRGLKDYHDMNKNHFRTRVTKGPPVCLRWVSWLVLNNLDSKRYDNIIDYYLSKNLDVELDNQISKDLDRTFSSLNSNYLNSELLKNSLSRILKAYAALDTDLGYCQGLNLITAFLLIVCNYNERDVFYILISILSNTFGNNFSIRGFFTDDFPLLKFYVFLFEEIFEKENKKLKQHLNKVDLPSDLWVTKWFQTLFTICLPLEICQRLWDCLFAKGLSFIISFSLALLKEFEVKLLRKNDNFDILEFFNKLLNSLANESLNLNETLIVTETKENGVNSENNNNNNEFNVNQRNSLNIINNKPSGENFSNSNSNSNVNSNSNNSNNEESKKNLNKNLNNDNKKQYSFSIEKIIKMALKYPISEKTIKKIEKKYCMINQIEYKEEDIFKNNIILDVNFKEIESFNIYKEENNEYSNMFSAGKKEEKDNNSKNFVIDEYKINFEEKEMLHKNKLNKDLENSENSENFQNQKEKEIRIQENNRKISDLPKFEFFNENENEEDRVNINEYKIEEKEFIYKERNLLIPKASSNFDLDYENHEAHEVPKFSGNNKNNDIGEAIRKLSEKNINSLSFKKDKKEDKIKENKCYSENTKKYNSNEQEISLRKFSDKDKDKDKEKLKENSLNINVESNYEYNINDYSDTSKEKDNFVVAYNNEKTSPRFRGSSSFGVYEKISQDELKENKNSENKEDNLDDDIDELNKEEKVEVKDLDFFDLNNNINQESNFQGDRNTIKKTNKTSSNTVSLLNTNYSSRSIFSPTLESSIQRNNMEKLKRSVDKNNFRLINENISINENSLKPKILLKVSSSKKLPNASNITNPKIPKSFNLSDTKNTKNTYISTNTNNENSSINDKYNDINKIYKTTEEFNTKNRNKIPKSISTSIVNSPKFEDNSTILNFPKLKIKKEKFLINTKNISSKRLTNLEENPKIKKPTIEIKNKKAIKVGFFEDSQRSMILEKLQKKENKIYTNENTKSNNTEEDLSNMLNDYNEVTDTPINKKDIKQSIFKKSKNNPLYVWKKN